MPQSDSAQQQLGANLTDTNGYEIFQSHIEEVLIHFPKLSKHLDSNGKIIVAGEIDLVDESQKHWDTYEIAIHYRDDYPYRFPSVIETGGKIPKIPDWHIYSDTGTCCFAIPPEEIRLCRQGITLSGFLKQIALPYFFNQAHRKVEGYYKNGEFAHGVYGFFQYYDEVLKTDGDVRKALCLMQRIISGNKPSRTEMCFCGKKEKFRRCHRDAFDTLTEIGLKNVEEDMLRIKKASGVS